MGCKSLTEPPPSADNKKTDVVDIPKFTELQEGDRIHLYFEHGSCVGVKVEGGTSFTFTSDYIVREGKILPAENEYTCLKLTQEDKEDLDVVMDYWHGDIDTFGSTASEILTVTYLKNGEIKCSKRYIDISGKEPPISIMDIFLRSFDRYKKTRDRK